MQRQTTGMPYLLTDKQCIQQITRPKMGKKNASRRATPSLSIVHNYVSAFTINKPDPTPCTVIYSQQRTQNPRLQQVHTGIKGLK